MCGDSWFFPPFGEASFASFPLRRNHFRHFQLVAGDTAIIRASSVPAVFLFFFPFTTVNALQWLCLPGKVQVEEGVGWSLETCIWVFKLYIFKKASASLHFEWLPASSGRFSSVIGMLLPAWSKVPRKITLDQGGSFSMHYGSCRLPIKEK